MRGVCAASPLPATGGAATKPATSTCFTRDLERDSTADSAHYDAPLHGSIAQSAELMPSILPMLTGHGRGVTHRTRRAVDREPMNPALLDVLLRVVINECI